MSLLTPLYVLGLSAVIAPLVFHLIRRSPRGEVPFSSLMFLSPTPPRLTRRSRLDHLLLLLLRAAALCLLALAFARPFVREAARLGFGDVERRRVALLIDTSASMRRGDVWARALEQADKVIAGCKATDQLAVFSFDAGFHSLLSFHEAATLDPSQRDSVAKAMAEHLVPTWGGTNLGQALVDVVSAIEDVADASEKSGRMPRRVVLISDLAQGSHLDALGDFEWPSDVDLELKTIVDEGSNAGLTTLADTAELDLSEPGAQRRVRVANDASSRRENFELFWVDETDTETGDDPVSVYVAPGESRVVRVPRPRRSTSNCFLRLRGDSYSFDNTIYFANERREEQSVLFVGPGSTDDHAGLLYYLKRVFVDTPRRVIHIISHPPDKPLKIEGASSVPLIIVTADTGAENAQALSEYIRGGGTVLYVVTAPGRAETLGTLAGVPSASLEESNARDVMLGEIKFDHPLFAPLSGPQFNDFTKIHFWKHRVLGAELLDGFKVLAKFEAGDVAVAEKADGKGRLVVLASGWQPADSQLARSSKFVPLMLGLLEARSNAVFVGKNHLVFDRVPIPAESDGGKDLMVRKPDKSVVNLPRGSAFFGDTALPGLYTVEDPVGARSFAVNIDPLESKTTPMQFETLEQLGCRLADHSPKPLSHAELRQMYNAELENRQKLWRWLILVAIGLLIVETLLAGRRAGARRPAHAEAMVT
jgi:Aerotolerance regulator N-terminal/von Willebrand factor type A domain